MTHSQLFFFTSVLLLGSLGQSYAMTQAENDMVTVLDKRGYSIAYFKSSIKALPPESKKVWIITNRQAIDETTKQRIGSVRSNILFNCKYQTFSTLAVIQYSESNAQGKKILQTETGFNLADDPVPEDSALAIIQKQVCNP
ncbi:surface-adhesin E family protein [Polynucleobacter sp. Nonnen-W13]|uniref:surface-adhesin E family protein n=1 Tax=Polynucleobacter sp. Nonnen-W13 TaxID=1855625 RepID=UPI001C0C66E5|nr:surface-adhesin E family protein [Polynucleobacter sp. Nonnen-W13]